MGLFISLFQRFSGDSFEKQDPIHQIKLQTFLWMHLLLFAVIFVYFIFLSFNEFTTTLRLFTNLFVTCVFGFNVIYILKKVKLEVPITLMAFCGFVSIASLSLESGGIYSADLIHLVSIIVGTIIFGSRTLGILTGSLCISWVVFLLFLDVKPSAEINQYYYAINIICAFLLNTFLISIIYRWNEQHKEKIEELKNEQLKNLDTQYKLMISHSTDIISLINEAGVRISVSPAAEKLVGRTDLLNASAEEICPASQQPVYKNLIQKAFKKNEPERFTIETINVGGDKVWLQVNCTPFYDTITETHLAVLHEKDITSEVNLEGVLVNMRKGIARDFHDQIGNKIASLNLISELLKTQLSSTKEAEKVQSSLSAIQQKSKQISEDFRDFIWSLKGDKANVEELFEYLKDFAEELFELHGIAFKSEFNITSDTGIDFDLVRKRDLVFLIKECFTNVIKHAQASVVFFEVGHENKQVYFAVSDNGVGFTKEVAAIGNGLQNMKERAKNSRFELLVEHEQGTRIKCIISK